MIRRLGYTLSALVLMAGAMIVPLPLVELAPGGTTSVAPLVAVDAEDTTPIHGSFELLTVAVRTPSLVDAVGAWWSPTRELDRRERVIPAGVDENEYFRLQRQQFERSFRVAVAVGLRAADQPVEVTTRPVVFSVLRGGPSDGIVSAGDIVLEVDGTRVSDADELVTALRDIAPGDRVQLTVDRGDGPQRVTITAQRIAGLDRPAGIGVAVETIANDVDLPFDVELDERSGIGGPSAGLLFALTVYDLVSEEDLAAGRVIAASGTIDVDGSVGPVGGIVEKVAAAEAAGADLLLVPETQVSPARAAARGDLRIVGVATLDDALTALRDRTA